MSGSVRTNSLPPPPNLRAASLGGEESSVDIFQNIFTTSFSLLSVVPVAIYSNAELQRGQILRENKNLAGVYL